MKTAISLPADTFDAVSAWAGELGISRSELFVRAVRRYLTELDEESTTREVDRALRLAGVGDSGAQDAVAAGHRRLAGGGDDW